MKFQESRNRHKFLVLADTFDIYLTVLFREVDAAFLLNRITSKPVVVTDVGRDEKSRHWQFKKRSLSLR